MTDFQQATSFDWKINPDFWIFGIDNGTKLISRPGEWYLNQQQEARKRSQNEKNECFDGDHAFFRFRHNYQPCRDGPETAERCGDAARSDGKIKKVGSEIAYKFKRSYLLQSSAYIHGNQ